MLEMLRIPQALLPRIVPSSSAGIPIRLAGHELQLSGIAGDQQAALFGQACFRQGMVKNTYGTGCFMLMNTGTEPLLSRNRLLSSVAWHLEGEARHFALEGSVFMGGAVIQWLRDGLGLIRSVAEVERLPPCARQRRRLFRAGVHGSRSPHWIRTHAAPSSGYAWSTAPSGLRTLEVIAWSATCHCISRTPNDPEERRIDGGAGTNTADAVPRTSWRAGLCPKATKPAWVPHTRRAGHGVLALHHEIAQLATTAALNRTGSGVAAELRGECLRGRALAALGNYLIAQPRARLAALLSPTLSPPVAPAAGRKFRRRTRPN
jgi:hypothetical protein